MRVSRALRRPHRAPTSAAVGPIASSIARDRAEQEEDHHQSRPGRWPRSRSCIADRDDQTGEQARGAADRAVTEQGDIGIVRVLRNQGRIRTSSGAEPSWVVSQLNMK